MEEPRYVDWIEGDRDLSIEGQDFHHPEICKKIFVAVRRIRFRFKGDTEIARYRRVDNGFHSGEIPMEWIDHCIENARKYPWGLGQALSAILNVGKMDEWVSKNVKSKDAEAPKPREAEYKGRSEASDG